MNREQKKEFVDSIKEIIQSNSSLLVIHYQGLTVAEITSLRKNMRDSGAGLKVVKNRLVKLAFEGTSYKEIASLLTGQTALAYSVDQIAAAKGLMNFAKGNEKIQILGGMVDEKTVDANGIKALSRMPSIDELRAKIIGAINAPASKFVSVLQAPAGQLARVVSAYSSK